MPRSLSVIIWRVTLSKSFRGCLRTAAGCRAGVPEELEGLQGRSSPQPGVSPGAPQMPSRHDLHLAWRWGTLSRARRVPGDPLPHSPLGSRCTHSPFTCCASETSWELAEPRISVSTPERKGSFGDPIRTFRLWALLRFPAPDPQDGIQSTCAYSGEQNDCH